MEKPSWYSMASVKILRIHTRLPIGTNAEKLEDPVIVGVKNWLVLSRTMAPDDDVLVLKKTSVEKKGRCALASALSDVVVTAVMLIKVCSVLKVSVTASPPTPP